MYDHLRRHAADGTGTAASFALWAYGLLTHHDPLQLIGAFVGVGMLAVGVSKEVRAWLDRAGRTPDA